MRKLLLLAAFAFAFGGAQAQQVTKSVQLSQDPSGPIGYNTSTKATTFPGAVTAAGAVSGTTVTGTGAASVAGLTSSDMIVSTAGLPTIASGACGATTNGAVVAGSTNQTGNITIGSASTTVCTVSFSKTLAVAPKVCIIQPNSTGSADVNTNKPYISSITTAGFVITGAALASSNYSYFCM